MNKAEEIAVAEALNQLRAHHNEAKAPEDARFALGEPAPRTIDGDGAVVDEKQALQVLDAANTTVSVGGGPPAYVKEAVFAANGRDAKSETSTLNEAPNEALPGDDSDSTLVPATQNAAATRPASDGQPQWRNVLLTATSLVLTKDARKKLRHLLSVLRLASEHLNTKVNALKQAMEQDADNDNMKPKISKVAIRNDIITTIKKCLAMLSTLASNTLPAAARGRVRNTLLKLPSRWANQLGNETITESDGKSESAALALATETLISIQNITNILSESMDRADSWVERLPSFTLGKRRRGDEPEKEELEHKLEHPELEEKEELGTSSQPSTRPESPAEEPETKALKKAE